MTKQPATTSINSLFDFLSEHITVSEDLRIEGCDGSLSLTAAWFDENNIEAVSGLEWIRAHGPSCNCDCEIYTNLQDLFATVEIDSRESQG
ncbi:MAG TPA: DUF2695 domain-containing protein [Anaerolineales bacterium]